MKFSGNSSGSSATSEARIVEWNTELGFGFLNHEGKRLFLHIRSFAARDLVPAAGDRVRYVLGTDPKGRPCAAEAVLIHRKLRAAAHHGLAQAFLLFLPFLVFLRLPTGFWPPAGILLGMSALTFLAYMRDKSAAVDSRRRVPESTLHLLELAGGWPGALLAQRVLRHKNSKPQYQRAFWLVVLCHQMLAFDLQVILSGVWESSGQLITLAACQ